MADSGRYQSRLFNFLHQRSRRLTQQCDRAFRHLQVSASWGVQLLLYPIYLLFQSMRSPGKQLHQTVQQSWPQLPDGSVAAKELSRQLPPDDTNSQPQTPPPADTPIQRVLLLVDALPSPEAFSTLCPGKTEPINFFAFLASNPLMRFASLGRFKFFPNSPKSTSSLTQPSSPAPSIPSFPTPYSSLADSRHRNRPVVRGIATQLSSRTLVLVTAQNEILDILSPQQQQKLHERIVGEVADYWHHQQLAHWAEIGKAYPTLRGIDSPLEYDVHTYQALAFLDRTLADLESNYLAPVSEVAITLGKRSWKLIQRLQSQLTSSFGGKAQPGDSKSPTTNATDTHTIGIQALIWAAIDYFFGRRGGRQLAQITPTTNSLELKPGSKLRRKPLPSAQLPPLLVSPDEDPWLTLSDLFSDPEEEVCGVALPPQNSSLEGEPSTQHLPKSQTMSQVTGKTNPALPSSQLGGYSLQNLLNTFQRLFGQSKQASGLVKPQKTTTSKAPAVGKGLEKVGSKQLSPLPKSLVSVSTGESSNQPRSQSPQLDPAPDWIETNATVIGYVKHPLEQLLGWLDQAMLWLENVFILVLRWVQQLLQGK